ncbi:MAG: hypothetical protein V4662_13845 [Verrucomicrobiota bacterium]
MKLPFLASLICLLALTSFADDDKPFTMLTDELIAKLPEAEKAAWTDYLAKSREFATNERRILAEESQKAGLEQPKPAPGNSGEFEPDMDAAVETFADAANQKLAEVVISYQTPTGGWSKAVDYADSVD